MRQESHDRIGGERRESDSRGPALRALRRIRGVTWRWRDDAPDEAKQLPGMGVVAQEVEVVFPELVSTDRKGVKRVHYEGLVGPLIAAVRELDERLAAAEARLAELEREGNQPQPPSE